MKFNQLINNFSMGEWSERMLAMVNTDAYQKACKSIQNMIIQKEGGAFQRAGLKYINPDVGSAGHQAVLDSVGYNINMFPIMGTSNIGELRSYILVTTSNAPGTDWFFYDVISGFSTSVVGANVSSFASVSMSLNGASYAYAGNVLFICTNGYIPIIVTIVAGVAYIDDLFSVALKPSIAPGLITPQVVPYYDPNVLGYGTPQTITSSATVGVVTLTASTAYFVTSMQNTTIIKLTAGGATGFAIITAVGGAGVPQVNCTATVLYATFPVPIVACGVTAGTAWEISAWNGYFGWPTIVASFEQRIFWGGKPISVSYPGNRDHNMVWASRSGDPFDMMELPVVQDPSFTAYASDNSRPFSFAPTAGSGPLLMLTSTKVLVLGYGDKEMVVRGTRGALGPLDISIESNTSFGSTGIRPVSLDNNTFYGGSGFKTVRQLIFSYENEQYKTMDVGFPVDLTDRDTYTIWQIERVILSGTSYLVVISMNAARTASVVFLGAIDEQNNIGAWTRLIPGNNGIIYKMVTTLSNIGSIRKILFLVKRTVNAGTKYFIEELTDIFHKSSYSPTDMFYYLDCYIEISPGGSSTITVTHLPNETVHIMADGDYIGTKTSDGSGNISLGAVYTRVVVGYAYTAKIIPAPSRMITQFGNSTGKVEKIDSLYTKFYNTINAKYGDPERGEYYPIVFRESSVVASTLTPLFTGSKRLQFPPGHSREKQIEFKNDLPTPMNILSISAEGVVYD